MTISQYDVEMLRFRQKEKERKHERAVVRWKYASLAVGYAAAAVAPIGVAYIIWMGVRGPSAQQVLEDQQKKECISTHGTWVKLADGDRSAYGTCIAGEVKQ